MSDLVVIAFPTEAKAEEVRQKILELQKEYLIELGDAAVHYEWHNWRAALNVINIADTIYVASCASDTSCFYGDRRRVTASLAYKW